MLSMELQAICQGQSDRDLEANDTVQRPHLKVAQHTTLSSAILNGQLHQGVDNRACAGILNADSALLVLLNCMGLRLCLRVSRGPGKARLLCSAPEAAGGAERLGMWMCLMLNCTGQASVRTASMHNLGQVY